MLVERGRLLFSVPLLECLEAAAHRRSVAVEAEVGELPCGASGGTPTGGAATDPQQAADFVAAYYEATILAGFSEKEALRFFGRPPGIDPGQLDLAPWPSTLAEKRYLKRFQTVVGEIAPGR